MFDISGKGFVRLRGAVGLENTDVGATLQPQIRFLVFDAEPDLDRLIPVTAGAPLPQAPPIRTAGAAIDRVFWYALSRAPSTEERAAAEQEYQKELTVLKTKKVLADQNVETAKGQARANIAIRESFGTDPRIAEALVRMRMIELLDAKWKGDMPQALGSGSLLGIGNTIPTNEAPPK